MVSNRHFRSNLIRSRRRKQVPEFMYGAVRDKENKRWALVRLTATDNWEFVANLTIPYSLTAGGSGQVPEQQHDYSWGVASTATKDRRGSTYSFIQGHRTPQASSTFHREILAENTEQPEPFEIDARIVTIESAPAPSGQYPITMGILGDTVYWMDFDHDVYRTRDWFVTNEYMGNPVEQHENQLPFIIEARDLAIDPDDVEHLICKATTLDIPSESPPPFNDSSNWEVVVMESLNGGKTWLWHNNDAWPEIWNRVGAPVNGDLNEAWDQDYWYYNEHNLSFGPNGSLFWLNEVIHFRQHRISGSWVNDDGYPKKEVWACGAPNPAGPYSIEILTDEIPWHGAFSVFQNHVTFGEKRWFLYSMQMDDGQNVGFDEALGETRIWQSDTPYDPKSWRKLPDSGLAQTTSPCFWESRQRLYLPARNEPEILETRSPYDGGWISAKRNLNDVLQSSNWDFVWGGMPLWIAPKNTTRRRSPALVNLVPPRF